MRFGFALRTMGVAANAAVLRESAARAEKGGLDTIWVPDHIAIPPDECQAMMGDAHLTNHAENLTFFTDPKNPTWKLAGL